MSTEILVNIGTQETRVALVEGGAAQEIYVQRAARHGLVGNIYKGTVKRVLPGMQAAFVDIGLERTAFLHVADMLNSETHAEALPPVERLLHEGQEVLVQILKDPLGSKGARLTTLLSIPSRYLVLMPHEKHVGVSTKIEDEAERGRLKAVLEELVPQLAPQWGVIARTAAEGADAESLHQDLLFLTRLWSAVSQQVAQAKAGQMVHGDLPLSMRILRDLLGTAVERVRIDSAEEARRVQQFAKVFVPQAAAKIVPYCGQAPIFDLYGVEDELNRALERKVELKSGGHLVIDQTEAMTTIDVNTGAFTGHRNLEETIVKTNLEAAA
ncbi:MAG: Rne/Rng family ribonuclease, partial [Nevskia sp.]|nr:Rne/Rng family ribonuclease [Nevskia sp.]